MASTNKIYLNPYYCELCDKTLISCANFEEHMAGAIHRRLLEALIKMTENQLQVFQENLKIGFCKQEVTI